MPLYCALCSNEDFSKHAHQGKLISMIADAYKLAWRNLRSKVADTLSNANDWFKRHGLLIDVLSSIQ